MNCTGRTAAASALSPAPSPLCLPPPDCSVAQEPPTLSLPTFSSPSHPLSTGFSAILTGVPIPTLRATQGSALIPRSVEMLSCGTSKA